MDPVLSLEVFSYPSLTAFTYSWEERPHPRLKLTHLQMSQSTPSNVQTVILNFFLNILMGLLDSDRCSQCLTVLGR